MSLFFSDIWVTASPDFGAWIMTIAYRYSLEEVVGKSNWLDDRWAEKERLLSYFSRHQVGALNNINTVNTVGPELLLDW